MNITNWVSVAREIKDIDIYSPEIDSEQLCIEMTVNGEKYKGLVRLIEEEYEGDIFE
tara:strand:+ start:484 stop:654 length:171 start_codon:yes stop_codon:yes gene_type:complete